MVRSSQSVSLGGGSTDENKRLLSDCFVVTRLRPSHSPSLWRLKHLQRTVRQHASRIARHCRLGPEVHCSDNRCRECLCRHRKWAGNLRPADEV